MRMSKLRTFCSSGHLRCRPGLFTTSLISPSWNTIAFWRWSTVYNVPETMSATSTSTATIGPTALMRYPCWRSSVDALPITQALARARTGLGGGRVIGPLRRLRVRRCAARRLLQELLERPEQQVARATVVHHHFVVGGEDLAHGVDIDPLARHLRCLGVFREHLAEARRLAFRVGDNALLVAFGFLLQARGRAARARYHVIGVGLAFVLLALAILVRLHRVIECRLHLLGRLRVLDRDRADLDAGVVAVVDLLHQLV